MRLIDADALVVIFAIIGIIGITVSTFTKDRDEQEFYGNGYKKGYEDALNNYSDWLKKQTTGFDYDHCEVLVDRNGIWESAIETYLKERSDGE